ncbi:MAG TPA: response regulator transcription factor [Actinomycetota bacterium]|nr:response regulator transcription factor [Actinomycetota bacterium]
MGEQKGRRSVLVVQHQRLVREAFVSLLTGLRDFDVREAATEDEGVRMSRELQPDIVLIDTGVAGSRQHLFISRIKRALPPDGRVLVIAEDADQANLESALAAGASAYTSKDICFEELRHTLRLLTEPEAEDAQLRQTGNPARTASAIRS